MGTAFILAAVAVIAMLGWRGVKREHRRVAAALREAETALRRRDAPLTLEKDPQTGVYRPVGRKD